MLRSAGRPITTTLRDFRSARRRASHRVSRNSGHVVLTSRGLHVITRPRFFFAPQDLAHCTVRDEGGRLRLSTSHPPEATGTVELRFAVDDAAAWIAALRERGVQLG